MAEKRAPRITIGELVKSGQVRPGDKWLIRRGRSDAGDIEGEVTSAGTLRVGDREFRSVSEAARQSLGTNTNGWKRWSYFNGSRWVYIDELRSAYKRALTPTQGS